MLTSTGKPNSSLLVTCSSSTGCSAAPNKNMLEKHKRLYNGEFCWVSGFLGKSKTEALRCTLLVDFVQPAPKWVRKNEMENHGYLEMLENSKVTYELACNLKRYSCIINPKRYSCIRFSKEILLSRIFKKTDTPASRDS